MADTAKDVDGAVWKMRQPRVWSIRCGVFPLHYPIGSGTTPVFGADVHYSSPGARSISSKSFRGSVAVLRPPVGVPSAFRTIDGLDRPDCILIIVAAGGCCGVPVAGMLPYVNGRESSRACSRSRIVPPAAVAYALSSGVSRPLSLGGGVSVVVVLDVSYISSSRSFASLTVASGVRDRLSSARGCCPAVGVVDVVTGSWADTYGRHRQEFKLKLTETGPYENALLLTELAPPTLGFECECEKGWPHSVTGGLGPVLGDRCPREGCGDVFAPKMSKPAVDRSANESAQPEPRGGG
uniref:Uncharacterized protein n=1 Tax=Anopheles farauti TaxID=69004 RepID=A0A182Q274_9DIPT